MSGSTSGILTGAVSTWNPFGGGGAASRSGGGGFPSAGRRLFLLHFDEVDFLLLGSVVLCRGLRRRVDHEQDEPVVRDKLRRSFLPALRVFFGFDSTRLLNMVLDRIGMRRVAGRRDSTPQRVMREWCEH